MQTIDGIVNEPTVNFVGKDGFFWWVGEVEDNEDPMELGRVKVRVLGYYTNVRGGTTSSLPTDKLPWATCLQHTSQAGNDGQGESSGQLQPGAIVLGFFMDGDQAQMPIVMGVLRVQKSNDTKIKQQFAFTGEAMEPGLSVNASALHPAKPNSTMAGTKEEGFLRQSENNTVITPGMKTGTVGGPGSPKSVGTAVGLAGSKFNTVKPRDPVKPIPAANGVGGPWRTLEYKLAYLIEDIADSAATLVKNEDGDFLDMITGKIVTAKELTAKVQNFLSAVFTQVVGAIRQSLANLAEQLNVVSLLAGATGIPFVTFTAVTKAVQMILSSLCIIDKDLLSLIQSPIDSLLSTVESFLDGIIDQAQMVLNSVQKVIDDIVCSVQTILNKALGIVSSVKGIVNGISQAQDLIKTWEDGTSIFNDLQDFFKNGITNLTGLMALFLKFAGSNCNRKLSGAKNDVGWYPLFGTTNCTPEELATINGIRGHNRGDCGENDKGGGLFDNILSQADPYLTAAKNFVNGASELYIGTPGRTATIIRKENGTTHTSVKVSQRAYAEYTFKKALREQKPEISDDEMEEKLAQYRKQQSGKKDDVLLADHTTYVGNHTEECHGDECKAIDGNQVTNIEGDYHLDITGDFHISVGGSLMLNAQGAPKQVKEDGTPSDETDIKKHSLTFGSDVDMNITGAAFTFEGSEFNMGAVNTKITGSGCEISSTITNIASGEILLTAENSVDITTPSLVELINFPPSPIPKVKTGILRKVGGSMETYMTPGLSAADAVPRHIVTNPAGFALHQNGVAYTNIVATGAWNATALAGVCNLKALAGVVNITAGAAMNLTATAAVNIKGLSIFLN
mgnify:FL=1